jgi:anthranilate synthase component 2
MILFIDNYDSFSHMLADYLRQCGLELHIIRNDETTTDELSRSNWQGIVISPGPATPADSGIVLDIIDRYHQQVPILGVCLGHQAIGQYFGARLIRSHPPVHGKTSDVWHSGTSLLHNVPSPFPVMRYHSLELTDIPEALTVTARTADDIVMAIHHTQWPICGVQFHPESVGTPAGLQIIRNWRDQVSNNSGKSA